jgi:hypothetical protein
LTNQEQLLDCAVVPCVRTATCAHILELSVKSCLVRPELHSSFDSLSTPGCCPQSHEMLLNKGMKYWDSGLNARGSRTFIATVHIPALESIQEKNGQGKLSLAPNLLLNSVSCPVEPRCTCFPVFWNLVRYVTKQGVVVPSSPDFTDKLYWPKVILLTPTGIDFTVFIQNTLCNVRDGMQTSSS